MKIIQSLIIWEINAFMYSDSMLATGDLYLHALFELEILVKSHFTENQQRSDTDSQLKTLLPVHGMSEMVNNGFPAIVLLGLCTMPKTDSNCCPRFHLVLGRLIRQCGKQVIYFKCRADKKPNTRNGPSKKKKKKKPEQKKKRNQEERKVRQRSQQGDCKKTGKQFQK